MKMYVHIGGFLDNNIIYLKISDRHLLWNCEMKMRIIVFVHYIWECGREIYFIYKNNHKINLPLRCYWDVLHCAISINSNRNEDKNDTQNTFVMKNSGKKVVELWKDKSHYGIRPQAIKISNTIAFRIQRFQPLYVDILTIMFYDLDGAQIAFCVTSNKYVLSFHW